MKRIQHLSIAAAGLFCSLLAAGAHAQGACKPAHQFQTITPGVLSIAAWDFPPYAIPAGRDDVKGVDGEIVKKIAAKECLKISVSVVDPAAVVQSVVSKKADIALGDWYRTADRAKVVGLGSPMYLDQMGIISKDGIDTVGGLAGKKIGTVTGYLWLADLQKTFGDSLVVYPNPVAMAQDLMTGRIDAGTDSYAVAQFNQKKGGYSGMKITVAKPDQRVAATLMPGQTTMPYTKSNTALGEALSADIDALRNSGEISKILQSYGLSPTATDVGAPRLVR
ncbi:substrate-binding periplasmic protein [Burkholderia sp. Ac-20379]|uniref:substrate-binding periplasmic protein n=1 Tax=Burkholderia sp. Ac-20379 TaxID=2703900 RepID=UPI00197DDEE2|nr:transporter substrate-binding domain-containing protein [Burkholderia sp. Ac-20379]MBN3723892.1 amino acid ABC transporter substrate-binding protein [Burkholderia sp. Ac-20379]